MPGPTIPAVHGNPRLNSLVVGYPEEKGFLATRVAPIMEVPAEAGTFNVVDFEYGRRRQTTRRSPSSPAPQSDPPLSTGSYVTREYAHSAKLLKRIKDNAMKSPDGFKQIEKTYSQLPSHVVLLDLEYDAAAAIGATSNYFDSSHYTTLSGTDQWSDAVNSVPIDDVLPILEAINARSSIMPKDITGFCDLLVYHKLKVHPHVKEQVKYVQKTNPDDIGPAQIAAYYGIKELIVTDVKEVTSAPGATEAVSRIWGKHFYLLYVEPNPNAIMGTSSAFVHASFTGKTFPIVESEPVTNPKGDLYIASGILGINKVAKTGEGVRTGGIIKDAIA